MITFDIIHKDIDGAKLGFDITKVPRTNDLSLATTEGEMFSFFLPSPKRRSGTAWNSTRYNLSQSRQTSSQFSGLNVDV